MSNDLIKRLWALDMHPESAPWQAADEIERLRAENEQARGTAQYWKAEHLAANDLITRLVKERDELAAEVDRLRELVSWAYDTLQEINPANYDHDDVCAMNATSVEVILAFADIADNTVRKPVRAALETQETPQ